MICPNCHHDVPNGILIVPHHGGSCGILNKQQSNEDHDHMFCKRCNADWIRSYHDRK